MSKFQPFVMEHQMGKWEVDVEYNLSESGVHPVVLRDLLENDQERIDTLLNTELNYPQVNGSLELREHISSLYPGASPDNVLVTVGAAEANFVAASTLVEPGQSMAVMVPNYMQIWGIGLNRGVDVRTFSLDASRDWCVDMDELRAAVGSNTKLIAVCNPNNPTGRAMTESEIAQIIDIADSVGAWIIADEVYAGAERIGEQSTPSLYGRYDKVIAIGSLSKAYGLPGLRLGWAVGPTDSLESMWYRHDYATITTTMLANQLGALALSPQMRPRLLERTRGYIRRGFPVLEQWLNSHDNLFNYRAPDAAAIAFVRYNRDIDSVALVEKIRKEKSVLVMPGDHFHVPQHLRISFGLPEDYLQTGLDRIYEVMMELGD